MQIACIVKPRSRVDAIYKNSEGTIIIRVKAAPIDGEANEYLINYLSTVFHIPKRNIEIVSGHTNSYKRINIVADEDKVKKQIGELPQK
ncbi:MAG TPA: DUF167 domain-containing protein [Bacteroidia bacterium]|nr:DUF167 domain-containing protein [Bacteroidia bacterium]